MIGRLTAVKGAVELVEAMALIEDPKVKLVILGQGDLEEAVSEMISRKGLEDRIKTCYQFVSEEERIRHLAACDIAVFPSKYEPFGIVALEAIGHGKAGRSGCWWGQRPARDRHIIRGEPNGCHVNGQDAADIFAWGLEPLLSMSSQELKEMGRRGRERVLEHFTWDRIARQTAEVYAQTKKSAELYGR